MSRITPAQTLLVVVDVQEAFRRYECFERVVTGSARLLAAARIVAIRAVVSEQYPKGLGHSAPELGIAGERVLKKTSFSAASADGFDRDGADTAIVCGIESHVCVENTVRGLLTAGVEVHLAADACGSRSELDHLLAIERMRADGAVIDSVESVLFGLFDGAGSDEFKAVQRLVL